jgi:hypothetical protein
VLRVNIQLSAILSSQVLKDTIPTIFPFTATPQYLRHMYNRLLTVCGLGAVFGNDMVPTKEAKG